MTVLVLLATALNFVPIALPAKAFFFLGPFLYMPLVLMLPMPWSILAAAIPLSVTIFTLGQPFTFALGLLEATWLSFGRVHSRRSAVRQDAIFWIVVTLPIAFWLYRSFGTVTIDSLGVVVVKQVMNQLSAVTVAVVLLRQTRLPTWLTDQVAVRRRLRDVYFYFAFLLAIVPLMLLVVGGSVLLRAYCERDDRVTLTGAGERLSQRVDLFLGLHEAAVANMANTLSRGGGDAKAMLEETRRAYPNFLTMFVADAQGHVTHFAASPAFGQVKAGDVGDREYFRFARDQDKPYVSGVFRGRGFGHDILVAICAPIHDAQGRFAGVVEASLEVHRFAEQIIGEPQEEDLELILADRTGRVIFADPATAIPHLASLRHFPQGVLLSRPATETAPADFVWTATDGKRTGYTAVAAHSPRYGVVVVAERPMLSVFKDALKGYVLVGIVVLGTLAVAIWAARRTRHQAAEPLEQFAINANRQASVREVEPIATPTDSAPYEVWIVYRAFNQLAVQLQATYERLRQTNRDLDRRVAERTAEAEAARQLAESASQSKTDFLARTGHEVRSPLTAILGHTDVLLKQTSDAAARERLQTIGSAGRRLLNVLNDLLDLSKVEAGKLELCTGPIELREICSEVTTLFSVQAQEAGLKLELEIAGRDPIWVQGDGMRLQQVLINLVGNALKFTRTGRIVVAADVIAGGTDHVSVRFAVRDTGPGITEEQRARLFQPYSQLERGSKTGTGLGLVISRQLVGLMGAELQLASAPGQGSEFHFTVTLPVAIKAPEIVADVSTPVALPRVLVADDDIANQEVVKSLLESYGVQVETVESAETAISALGQGRFDVALIDLEMPDGDGYSVARATRDRILETAGPACRLIAFSAHRRDEVWGRCAAAGFVDFVEKPTSCKALLRAVVDPQALAAVA
ncbi:MAG TPA: ATP-binding protein [Opitutaceae bacterium]|nr:ATP-binding protein [Opitutaceae bacterium]